ncbi:MAG: hypothetical protein H6774_02315 [Pseudomonadales bacterium]|nr:hypothetical protein [Candidatus Woesebacteria bacterium]MCB9801901.1 hypothetical protein [Pseudomonadales bacterium]
MIRLNQRQPVDQQKAIAAKYIYEHGGGEDLAATLKQLDSGIQAQLFYIFIRGINPVGQPLPGVSSEGIAQLASLIFSWMANNREEWK